MGLMDKNHDDQCARVKDPEMGLFSSARSGAGSRILYLGMTK